jgi:hypothetical protein
MMQKPESGGRPSTSMWFNLTKRDAVFVYDVLLCTTDDVLESII